MTRRMRAARDHAGEGEYGPGLIRRSPQASRETCTPYSLPVSRRTHCQLNLWRLGRLFRLARASIVFTRRRPSRSQAHPTLDRRARKAEKTPRVSSNEVPPSLPIFCQNVTYLTPSDRFPNDTAWSQRMGCPRRSMSPGQPSRMKLEALMITITGTVGSSGKYLVTGIPVDTTANAVLKIVFENNTSGTNLALFAGTTANFESGSGGMQLSDSGGPGFRFLTIIDTQQLSSKIIFVRREVGSANAQFTLTVD